MGDERRRLEGAADDDDLLRRTGQAARFRQIGGDLVGQAGAGMADAVARLRGRARTPVPGRDPAEDVIGKLVEGGHAGAEAQRFRALGQEVEGDEPGRALRQHGPAGRRRGRAGRGSRLVILGQDPVDEGAGAMGAPDIAFRLQPVIGLHHRIAGERQFPGQDAARREARSARDHAFDDAGAEPGEDLLIERGAAVALQPDQVPDGIVEPVDHSPSAG